MNNWDTYTTSNQKIEYKELWFKEFDTHMDTLKWNIENAPILDIGCGNGRFLKYFKSKFNLNDDLFGVDILDNINSDNFLYYKADARKLPFQESMFNMTSCLGVLEHFENHIDRIKIINEMIRVTKSNGYIIITVPELDPFSFMYYYLRYIDDRKNEYKHYTITEDELKNYFAEHHIIINSHLGWFFEFAKVPKLFNSKLTSNIYLMVIRVIKYEK